jgi:hypothetical protein
LLDEKDMSIDNIETMVSDSPESETTIGYSPNSRFTGRRYTLIELEKTFVFKTEKSNDYIESVNKYVKKYLKPSSDCMKGFFLQRFPFILMIYTYDVKNNLIKDLIAGITVRF